MGMRGEINMHLSAETTSIGDTELVIVLLTNNKQQLAKENISWLGKSSKTKYNKNSKN